MSISRNAVVASIVYRSFMSASFGECGFRLEPVQPEDFEQFGEEERIADAEMMLEQLRPTLAQLCEDHGYCYEVPVLTIRGAQLLTDGHGLAFVKEYARLLHNMERDPFSTSFI